MADFWLQCFFLNLVRGVYTFTLAVFLDSSDCSSVIYIVLNLSSGILLIRMEALPFKFIREVIMMTAWWTDCSWAR